LGEPEDYAAMTARMRVKGVALLMLTLGAASPAAADAVVTACANDTQTGAGTNLAQAMAAGGIIRFNCPPGSVIRVSGRYDLPGSTRIDGGGAVTLDGGGIARTFLTARQNIVLRRIALRGFTPFRSAVPAPGATALGGQLPSALLAFGDAELDEVSVGASDFPFKFLRKGTVSGSSFIGNTGVGLEVKGEARISGSRFIDNEEALFMGEGSVHSCEFQSNTKGAVRINGPDTGAEVLHSKFTGNRGGPALAMASQARQTGPIEVRVRANAFTDNADGAIHIFDTVEEARRFNLPAAAINALMRLPPARFTLFYNQFSGNRGGRGSAITAELARAAGLISTGDIFVNNTSTGEGGAVFAAGGSLTLTHAVLRGNHAASRGAAISADPSSHVSVANSLIVGNTGSDGAVAGGTITLANVTVAENGAAGLTLNAPGSRVVNALFGRNRPANCVGVAAGVFQGRNAVSDASCPGVEPSEVPLDTFFVPEQGSIALRAGDPAVCRNTPVDGFDLTFQGRLDPTGCALGAFESAPAAKLARRTDRREVHADLTDDFTEGDGYRSPPPLTGSPSPGPAPGSSPADTLTALRRLGVDFSVPEPDLREWLTNSQFTPYPSITPVLLNLLRPNGLRGLVYLDVIVWNYEHAPDARSPREVSDVNLDLLKAAIVEGFNTRHGTTARTFADIVQ
jgi:hypothetical protein